MEIQFFDDINTSHAATGYPGRTDLSDFHIFTIESTYPHTRRVMPPYRFDFYQIVLFENSTDAALNMNATSVNDLNDRLFFASPEHVLAWQRGDAQRGFIVYFKAAFLAYYPRPVLNMFPYFRINALNAVPIPDQDNSDLHGYFVQLLRLFESHHPYRIQTLQALLLALLFECKRLYDGQERVLEARSSQHALVFRFQQFINQHYLTRKKVSDYAALLAVSPDYLGQVVKANTGKTPLRLIADRIVLEAKNLLTYSDLTMSEIAAYLGYGEPTHFGRFFRVQTGYSPSAWRNRNR